MSKRLKDRITILTTTHYIASAHRLHSTYPANHDRKFTHTNLINGVIENLYKRIGCDNFRHVISLDHDTDNVGSNEYYENLLKLKDNYLNLDVIYTTRGIYYSIKNLVESVKTDYYLWWEHDWELLENLNLQKFVDVMDKHNNINYIRFNKRTTRSVACDTMLWDTYIARDDMDLTGTSCWSNNPYFGRKSKMLEWYDMMDKDTSNFHPTIELLLQTKMVEDIYKFGQKEAEKIWGVFIYGKQGESQRIQHLNGKDK